MTDAELMQAIRAKYGAFIDEAVKGTPFPAALVAALVANESGLNEQAARFEHKVLGDLAQVIIGHKAAYGSIGAQDLTDWIAGVNMSPGNGSRLSPQAAVVLAMVNLATSWGPTQIMGYHAVAGQFSLSELTNLKTHFSRTAALLDEFRKRFDLPGEPVAGRTVALASSAADYSRYFHCWNAGSPGAATFDPDYTGKGLQRMQLYESLAAGAPGDS